MAGYGTDEAFATWASDNGYSVPDDLTAAVLRQRGSEYIDGIYGNRFPGTRTDGYAQERAWPRADAVLCSGETVPDDVIPDAVIKASYHAAYAEAVTPGSLSTSYTPGTAKVLTKVDKIEWEVVGKAEGAN